MLDRPATSTSFPMNDGGSFSTGGPGLCVTRVSFPIFPGVRPTFAVTRLESLAGDALQTTVFSYEPADSEGELLGLATAIKTDLKAYARTPGAPQGLFDVSVSMSAYPGTREVTLVIGVVAAMDSRIDFEIKATVERQGYAPTLVRSLWAPFFPLLYVEPKDLTTGYVVTANAENSFVSKGVYSVGFTSPVKYIRATSRATWEAYVRATPSFMASATFDTLIFSYAEAWTPLSFNRVAGGVTTMAALAAELSAIPAAGSTGDGSAAVIVETPLPSTYVPPPAVSVQVPADTQAANAMLKVVLEELISVRDKVAELSHYAAQSADLSRLSSNMRVLNNNLVVLDDKLGILREEVEGSSVTPPAELLKFAGVSALVNALTR